MPSTKIAPHHIQNSSSDFASKTSFFQNSHFQRFPAKLLPFFEATLQLPKFAAKIALWYNIKFTKLLLFLLLSIEAERSWIANNQSLRQKIGFATVICLEELEKAVHSKIYTANILQRRVEYPSRNDGCLKSYRWVNQG